MKIGSKLIASILLLAVACSASLIAAPTKVSFWHIGTAANDRAFYENLKAAYEKAHPDVTVEITVLENEAFKAKLATLMQSGTPPDIFHSWGGGTLAEYAQAGLLRDVTKLTKGTAWGNSMAPGVWNVYQYQGKQYGSPHDMGAITFWYNKDLLAKAGYKSFPTDWDDFLTLVKKLKAAGITPMALGGRDKWPAMHMWSYLALRVGGREAFDSLFSGKGKGFNDPAFVKAGQMLVELAALKPFQDGFLGATFDDESALVGNGQAAMELMGQWAPNNEVDKSIGKKGLGDKLGAAPFPSIKGGKGQVTDVIGGGNGYAVGKNASDAAVDFLRFFNNVENNAAWAASNGAIPTVKGAETGIKDANARLVKAIVDKCSFYQLYLDQFLTPAAGGAVNDAVQAMLAGSQTPAQACAAMQKAYEESK
jgi:raffinose/stachyose/melibiose transport system substrate-binding protein